MNKVDFEKSLGTILKVKLVSLCAEGNGIDIAAWLKC